MSQLNIRTYTWMQGGLSWAYVMERIMTAFEELGHTSYIVSTNGLKDAFIDEERMLKSVLGLQKFGPGKQAIDIDITYTVPQNFPKRFLPNSKHKCAIYNYETTYWDPKWVRYYGLADYYFPSSNFSAEVFYANGVPPEKTFVIPHGVDTKLFNPNVPAIKLNTKKKFKFVAVVAPHFRKNIDILLDAYCKAFTNKDDVCLVLKTKVYKHSDGTFHPQNNTKGRKPFEIVLGDVFKTLQKRYGKNMPEIELLHGHVENVSSIYNACDCHVTATGSEGFGMPMLESMACGLLNIAPNYSGHLDFMNEKNALLTKVKIRRAKPTEQYWAFNPKSKISEPLTNDLAEAMRKMYTNSDEYKEIFKDEMDRIVKEFSWTNAVKKIIDATEGNIEHYIPGTYKLPK